MCECRWADEACGPLMTVAGFQFGLLTICANHDPSVNQLLPPLTIREDEAAEVLQIPERMVTWLAKRL